MKNECVFSIPQLVVSIFKGPLRTRKRAVKFLFQRLTRGWDDSASWNVAQNTAAYMLPRLRVFRKKTNGTPFDLTLEEWHAIIDEIIWYLEGFDDSLPTDFSPETMERHEKASQLFGKYFGHLWW